MSEKMQKLANMNAPDRESAIEYETYTVLMGKESLVSDPRSDALDDVLPYVGNEIAIANSLEVAARGHKIRGDRMVKSIIADANAAGHEVNFGGEHYPAQVSDQEEQQV